MGSERRSEVLLGDAVVELLKIGLGSILLVLSSRLTIECTCQHSPLVSTFLLSIKSFRDHAGAWISQHNLTRSCYYNRPVNTDTGACCPPALDISFDHPTSAPELYFAKATCRAFERLSRRTISYFGKGQ